MSENEVSSHKELFTDTKNNVHFNNSTIISTDINTKFQIPHRMQQFTDMQWNVSISEHEGFFAEFSQSKVSQLRSVRRSPRFYLILISNSLQNYDKLR